MHAKQIIEAEDQEYVPTGSNVLRVISPALLKEFKRDFAPGSKWVRVNPNFPFKNIGIAAGVPVNVTVIKVDKEGVTYTLDDYASEVGRLEWPHPNHLALQKTSNGWTILDKKDRPLLIYSRR